MIKGKEKLCTPKLLKEFMFTSMVQMIFQPAVFLSKRRYKHEI